MNLLNRYFTPFAALLIISAIYFTEPDRQTVMLAAGTWVGSIFVNWWLANHIYRYIGWANRLKSVQVWINFVWAIPLFYLLQPFWAPMWLLFVMAPVTAALYQGRTQTVVTAVVSAGTMLALYWARGLEGDIAWGMAMVHAAFIVVFSIFVFALAETALRMRDMSAPR